ncbi:MAG: SH3 domain-containing protein [Winogradskyella sp.]|uniref:SH3 domain-containing protein n=1 Tax=Winogradskyella sp. TaxID=1883156 RepID=UPI000F3D2C8D|nr:SH3 domain-containing protein [Winogradskyella sp.]RNC87998.1 MAG: SH3 domain-containing protein [Winogradskyella sp.]
MFLRVLVVACFALSVASAQDIQYVFAENGLVIREQPNQGATKIGILDYGTAVEVIEYTDLSLDVKDKNKKVSGQWVKIKGPEAGEYFREGYIFNGYLTESKIESPLKVYSDAFTVFIDELGRDAELKTVNDTSTLFSIKQGISLEDRYLKVKHHQEYRTIEVFQSYRNSIATKSKDGDVEVIDFQHYNSSWKPLKMLPSSDNVFKTKVLSKKDSKRFGTIDDAKLKAHLETNDDVSFNIVPSQIKLKVLMTDIDGYKTEKIIIFELPLKA